MIKIIGYLRKDWVQLKEELKDSFGQADSQINMNTRSAMEPLHQDQREHGVVGLKAFDLTYDILCWLKIATGALAENLPLHMLLGAHQSKLNANAGMKLQLDPRDPSMFKYDQLQMHVLETCVTADALPLLDSEKAHTVLGVSSYSVPAGVPLRQMLVVTNLPAIPSKRTPAPVQATDEIPIAKADNTINMKMDSMMKAFET
jgi:hypothetical protein